MNKIIYMGMLLLLSFAAHAQTVVILDQKKQTPVENATLMSEKPKLFSVTNKKGEADVSAFPLQTVIVVRCLGYKTLVTSREEMEKVGYRITIEPSNINLDEVVISAKRWKESSEEVPVKIVAISADEIALQNPQTAADLLGSSGGVFIQKSQQGGGSPMIRGFATNRLLYSVDGVRMNTAIFRAGNIQNVINLDPFAMENVEVMFGPGSVIYGSDAIGGVMSFQTLNPQLSLNDEPLISGKAVARYSSANSENTGHFDVSVGWKKWAIATSFSAWNYDHLRQGANGPDDYLKPYYVQRQDSTDVVIAQEDPLLQIPTAYAQINMMQKVRFAPNEHWDVVYGFHYSNTSAYGRYDRHNRVRNGTARYAEWNYGPQLWMMNNLSIVHSKQNGMYDQLSIKVAMQDFEESRIDRNLNNVERNTQAEKVKAYSVNMDLIKSIGQHNKLYYGAEYVLNDVASSGQLTDIATGVISPGPSRYPQSTWNSMAVYVNDEIKVKDNLVIQAGARYNQYGLEADFTNNLDYYPFPFSSAEFNQSAITGSLGVVFAPTEKLKVSANAGTAFRSPNVDDLGKVFDSEPGAVTIPNPDVKAEYATSYDVGMAKIFGDFMKIDINGFYTVLNDALVRRNFTLNGADSILYDGELSQVQAIQNAAKATVYGVQVGVDVELGSGFAFSTDWSFQKGEEELDDGTTSPSRHAAPLFGNARLSYQSDKLMLQFYAMYQDEKSHDELPQEEQAKTEIYAADSQGLTYAPSWYTLNVKANYTVLSQLIVGAGVENITDQRYRPYSSGVSAAGRNFVLSLTAKF
ncbi:MAG: hypothetical protein RL226_1309 [Bacteroidota bacterium]